MKINYRQIETFRAVMLSGAMTTAAETMGITQPAVSRLIRDLEFTLELTLFHRRGNKIAPTAEAVDLLAEVERSFVGLEHLAAHAENLRRTRSGVLRIAALPAMAVYFLPRFIAAFCRNRPDVRVQIDGIPSHLVAERLAGGQYDIGVTRAVAERPSVEFFPIKASAVVVMPDGHKLAKSKEIWATELVDETVIMLSPRSLLRHSLETALAGVRRRLRFETSYSVTACSLVLAGAGVTVVDPFCAYEFEKRGVTIRPFKPSLDVGYRFVISRDRPLSRLAAQFMEEYQAHIASFLAERSSIKRELRAIVPLKNSRQLKKK